MKWFIFSLLLLSFFTLQQEEALPEKPRVVKRADFRIALKYLLNHEGYYSNHRLDAGGETYCGIARNMYPNFVGWKCVDEYKRHHKLKWNDSIPGIIKWYVDFHYVDIWTSEDFFSIVDQDIANYCFDTRINMGYGAKIIQSTLKEMTSDTLKVNNKMDSITVKYLNKVHKWEFLARLMSNKIKAYNSIVENHPNQVIFLHHWTSRTTLENIKQ